MRPGSCRDQLARSITLSGSKTQGEGARFGSCSTGGGGTEQNDHSMRLRFFSTARRKFMSADATRVTSQKPENMATAARTPNSL